MSTSSSDAGTLWSSWRANATSNPDGVAVVHWVAGEEPRRWRWADLLDRAERYAAHLAADGVKQGEVCALIVRHNYEFYPLYMGIVRAGALPAVLAYPNPRLHPDKFRDGLEGMAKQSGLDWILTERDLEPVVAPLIARGNSDIGILYPLESEPSLEAPAYSNPDPESAALLQHSSGTTGLQKAVVLSHRTVLSHVRAYASFIGVTSNDCIVSWLPLYHDMGLIAAFQLPLAVGVTTVQLDPFEWVVAPSILMDAISSEGGTVAWLPNFAYNLLADRVHDDEMESVSLDRMRLFINCSEPVRADSHDRFRRRFAADGLRADALAACYAMAEATFAVTQTPPGHAARTLKVSAASLSEGKITPAGSGREFVSSGFPLPGCEIQIIDNDGSPVPDDRVGEIKIRSSYLFDGYRNNPAATSAVLKNDWYFTGDFGFMHEGECYVIGRKKDIIIVAGKNIYPEDIESQVSLIPRVLPGRVVAFGVPDSTTGTEQVWIVLETEAQEPEHDELKMEVLRAGMEIDVTISKVVMVPPRWLIKSSAGKPSRRANRERILLTESVDG